MAATNPVSNGQDRSEDSLRARLGSGRRGIVHPDQVLFILDADVDDTRYVSALQNLVNRHVLFRTGFPQGDDGAAGLRSVVQTDVDSARLDIEDWRRMAGDAQRISRLESFRQLDAYRGFDLSRPPLLRMTVIRWSDTRSAILMTTPHGLLDERSRMLLLEEWLADCTGKQRVNSGTRHADIHHDLATVLERLRESDDANFWREYLSGIGSPVFLDLPVARAGFEPGPPVQEFVQELDTVSSERIHAMLAGAAFSMTTLGEAALACLLARYADADELLLGVYFNGRSRLLEAGNGVAGPFRTVLPLRVRINSGDSIADLLHAVQDGHRKLRAREHCSCHDVLAALGRPEHQALFDTSFEYFATDPQAELAASCARYGAAQFAIFADCDYPLGFQLIDGHRIGLRLRARRGTLDAELAKRMLRHFATLLEGLCANSDRPLASVPMLDSVETAAIRWPDPVAHVPAGRPELIHERFQAQASLRPDAIAVACGTETISYGELNRRADIVAGRLVDTGVRPGNIVGLCAARQPDLLSGMLGILKAGAAYLPLDPDYPDERLKFMVEDAGVRTVLVPDALRESLPDGKYECVRLGFSDAEKPPAESRTVPLSPNDIAYVIYTSGSTGRPKGVMVSHRNVTRLFDACDSWLNAGPDDVWSLFHSFAFDFSVWEIWGALFFGGRLEVVPFGVSRSPEQFRRFLDERKVTVLSQTPSAFHLLAKEDARAQSRLTSLRLIVFGGEALELSRLRNWLDRYGDEKPRLVNMYGITETTVHVTYRRLHTEDLDSPAGSCIGWPLPDLYVRLLDRSGNAVPPGMPGEICVGGAGVTPGYLNRPELNAERFIPDRFLAEDSGARLYRSGDFARRLETGELVYLGRRDNEVKIRGFRVDLGEISNTLRMLPQISDAAATVWRAPDGLQRLVAYYVATGILAESEVRRMLSERLPAHMQPGMLIPVGEIPLTLNNKVDFRRLPDPGSVGNTDDVSAVRGRTVMENRLLDIWSSVLARRNFGPDDDFFALGGDSILALDVVAKARERGIDISPNQLFQYSRLSELAAELQGQAPSNAGLVNESGPILTHVQRRLLLEEPDNPDRLNRSMLLAVPEYLDLDALEQAWRTVIMRHDGLHMRFLKSESGSWSCLPAAPRDAMEFSRIDLIHLDREEQNEAIALIAADLRESLNIHAGLLTRVAHFSCGASNSETAEADRLMVVVHRLALAVKPWQALLSEVEREYRILSGNDNIVLQASADAAMAAAQTSSDEETAALPFASAELDGVLPLSPIQQLYYTVSGAHEDLGADLWVFELEGEISPELFRRAWNEIFRRHDILRTVFVDEGLPDVRQLIMKQMEVDFSVHDWRRFDKAEREAQFTELLGEERRNRFLLSKGPLTRLTLVREGDWSWRFVWAYHRIQIDGWSWPVLLRDFGRIYDALNAGRDPGLPQTGSYREYIEWLTRRDLDAYAAFWREQLQDVTSSHLLMRAGARPNGNGSHGKRTLKSELTLPRELGRSVERFARSRRMTPSMIFQGAWALLVAAFTGTFDVTVGVAYSGRTAGVPGGESIVGPFVNDLPVRFRIQPALAVGDWLEGLRMQQAGLNEFQNVAPAEIHRWTERSPASRLFDTLLVFQNYAVGEAGRQWGSHIKARLLQSGIASSYPLALVVTPGNHYQVDVIADDELVSRETIEAIALNLIATLNLITVNPDARLRAVIERTPKLRLAGLPEPASARRAVHGGNGSAGGNELEREIEAVICEVLDVDHVGMEQNFFDIGANSVAMLEIHRLLQARLKRRFPIVRLFQHPTPRSLAAFIGSDGEDTPPPGRQVNRAEMMRRQRSAASTRRQVR